MDNYIQTKVFSLKLNLNTFQSISAKKILLPKWNHPHCHGDPLAKVLPKVKPLYSSVYLAHEMLRISVIFWVNVIK